MKKSAGTAKGKRAPLSRREGSRPRNPLNPRLNAQTRKVLTQHYRAKYGVK